MKQFVLFHYNLLNFKTNKSFLVLNILCGILIIFTALQTIIPPEQLTKDTIAITGGKFYHGLLSNIGLFLWGATTTICFFSYIILKKSVYQTKRKFILGGALLSFILLLDDFLLLHELVSPRYLGLSENYLFLTYFLLLLSFNLYFLREIVAAQVLFIFFAFTFFALSVICDKILPQYGRIVIIEDGFKFLGIVGWFSFFAQACLKTFRLSFKTKSGHKESNRLYGHSCR